MADSKPLLLLFQDDWIVAIDKPPGHLVHPADEPDVGDLVAMKILRDELGKHVYPIHRLDRPTSGVLLFALDREVAKTLHQAFESHEVQKTYWAWVDGVPAQPEWVCEEPIQKVDGTPWREARTDFRILEHRPDGLTLVEATPKTGRYHQIRRHLAGAGLPIVGDYRYAEIERCDALGKQLGTGTRMLLHAVRLELTHPFNRDALKIECRPAEWPTTP